MLVKGFRPCVFCVDEKTDASRGVEDLQKLFHCRDQEYFSETLPMKFFGNRQAAKANSGDTSRQSFRLIRRQRLRLNLAKVQREKAENGFGFRGCFIHQDEGARNAARSVLPRRLFEKQIQRFTATIKSVAIMERRQRLYSMHAQSL